MSAGREQGRRQTTTSTINHTKGYDMARGKRQSKPAAPVEAIEPSIDEGEPLTAIRTTFTPGEVIRVGAAELLDLKRQGLVLEVVGETDDDEDDTDELEGSTGDPSTPPTGEGDDDEEGGQS